MNRRSGLRRHCGGKRFMSEKPKRRDENIVNKYMWSSILTGALLVFVLSMIFLVTDTFTNIFRYDESNKYLLTGYFTFFVFASVFNAFNARTDKLNLFENITKNDGFMKIIALIVIVQVFMTYFGGVVLRSYGLNLKEWTIVLLMAVSIIPVDLLRKYIVGKEQLQKQ